MFQTIVPTRRLYGSADAPNRDISLPRLDPPPKRQREMQKDLRTLARFIETYCKNSHPGVLKREVRLKRHDVEAAAGHPVCLCPACTRLLTHAFTKRSACPMNPKPLCKNCPKHCYHPQYRHQIREVMRFSGIKLLLTGRLHYLLHLFF